MKITPDNFSIKFTNAELVFAASALGFHQINLFTQWDWQNLEQLMAMGQLSLQTRGLVRVGAANQVEMDVFLDGLIHWMQDPEWLMVFNVHRPTAEDTWTVFFRQSYLLCHHMGEMIEFTLFESSKKAQSNILHQIGLGVVATPPPILQREKVQAVIDVNLWQRRQGEMLWRGTKRFQNTTQGSYLEISKADENCYQAVSINDLLSMDFI